MESNSEHEKKHYDVVVVGAGAAGVGAAVSAAQNGARTLLVEGGATLGGDMVSGLPINGCRSARGEWIVGGVATRLFDECRRLGGYIGSIYDGRNICVVIVNPRVMGFAVLRLLRESGVRLLPYTQAYALESRDGRIASLDLVNKTIRKSVTADVFIDCTGDGDIAAMAGAPFEVGGARGETQPATMVFQFMGVDPKRVLGFVRDHPENCGLGENPHVKKTAKELAQELYDRGIPKVFFSGDGPLLKRAIEDGELYATSMLALNPNSLDYTCITINSTRIVLPDNTDGEVLGDTMLTMTDKVEQAVAFIKRRIPGFENAQFNGIAPRLGVRESRRIEGEYRLTEQDVAGGVKRDDGVCKGGHEIDVHGKDKDHVRLTIKDAGSYDIPLGCLLPKGTTNLLLAGRCLSSDRIANSSARNMGTCLVMGQAAGTAAALCAKGKIPPRALEIPKLRDVLRSQGAILDGTK